MGLMDHSALWLTLMSGGASARIVLSPETVSDTAVGGDLIGTLSVINGRGTYTFTITADPDSKFVLDGTDSSLLEVEAMATFTDGDSHSVTIQADNSLDAALSATFSVRVATAASSGPVGDGFLLVDGSSFLLATNGDYLILS